VSAPIRVGIIGYGTAGRVFHAPLIAADPEFEVAGIVTTDERRRAGARREHPAAVLVGSVAELLDGSLALDLVVVASPSSLHTEHALAAVAAGCSVVVDKPFAPNADEVRRVIEAAHAAGVTLSVFQNRRWDGDFLTVRALLASDDLGDIYRFESRFEWWMPRTTASWKSETPVERGGGILYDLGAHLIDQAVELFGPAELEYADIRRRRADGAAPDDVFVALRHGAGPVSHLWMNALAAQSGPRFRILGSRGAYTSWGLDPQEHALASGASPSASGFGSRSLEDSGMLGSDSLPRHVTIERGDYAAFYRGLADSLLRGAQPPVDPEDALRTIDLIDSIHRTITTRK
jgi:predicted dehydrogenase